MRRGVVGGGKREEAGAHRLAGGAEVEAAGEVSVCAGRHPTRFACACVSRKKAGRNGVRSGRAARWPRAPTPRIAAVSATPRARISAGLGHFSRCPPALFEPLAGVTGSRRSFGLIVSIGQ